MFSVNQSCPTLCDLMDYSLPGSSVHGIFQARVLERVAISFGNPKFQTLAHKILHDFIWPLTITFPTISTILLQSQ